MLVEFAEAVGVLPTSKMLPDSEVVSRTEAFSGVRLPGNGLSFIFDELSWPLQLWKAYVGEFGE